MMPERSEKALLIERNCVVQQREDFYNFLKDLLDASLGDDAPLNDRLSSLETQPLVVFCSDRTGPVV
jgi:hypothetical protein